MLDKLFRRQTRDQESPITPLKNATLVITHTEICNRHGTGALLQKILAKESPLIVFYSRHFFERNEIGDFSVHLQHKSASEKEIKTRIARTLKSTSVARILCVPFYPDDALSALAAADFSGAGLILYLMDDQNIHEKGISDELMERLINRATIRFAISEPLRQAYSAKFGKPFWIIPPLAVPELFAPANLPLPNNEPPKGVLIGNLWSLDVVNLFRSTVRESQLTIDWYGNAGKPFVKLESDEAARDGIYLRSMVPDEALVAALRRADYAVMPTGLLNGQDSHDWLARASLPSRLIYLMTTANLPIVVLGHPETASAQFVTQMGIGVVCDYNGEAFSSSVQAVTAAKRALEIRGRAHELSPLFSNQGLTNWMWQSADAGKPIDERYENIFSTAR